MKRWLTASPRRCSMPSNYAAAATRTPFNRSKRKPIMTKSIHIAALTLLLFAAAAAVSQNAVAPPPRPANDAPANAEVLKLLRAAMPESVVLNKIHAATGKFDTSVDALVALKQAGAS